MNLGPLVGLVVIVGACAIAVWIATRVRSPLVAFFLAWVATPPCTLALLVLFWPALQATIPANNDGTAVIMIPILGVATGLVSGIVATVMVHRRRRADDAPAPHTQVPSLPLSDS